MSTVKFSYLATESADNSATDRRRRHNLRFTIETYYKVVSCLFPAMLLHVGVGTAARNSKHFGTGNMMTEYETSINVGLS